MVIDPILRIQTSFLCFDKSQCFHGSCHYNLTISPLSHEIPIFFAVLLQQLQSNKLRASSQGAPQSKRNPLHRTKAGSIHAALSDADSPKALEPTKTSGWVWAGKIDQKTYTFCHGNSEVSCKQPHPKNQILSLIMIDHVYLNIRLRSLTNLENGHEVTGNGWPWNWKASRIRLNWYDLTGSVPGPRSCGTTSGHFCFSPRGLLPWTNGKSATQGIPVWACFGA